MGTRGGTIEEIVVLDDNYDDCVIAIQSHNDNFHQQNVVILSITKSNKQYFAHRTYTYPSGL